MTAPLSPSPDYCSYRKIRGRRNIVVVGPPLPSTVLTISHWPNNTTPDTLKRDTSTASVFAYLDSPEEHVDVPWVSANHFDEDGLFSLFAVCRPDLASRYRELLIDSSFAGDFGIVRTRDAARLCFIIESFADPSSSPLEKDVFVGCEHQTTAALFNNMLEHLPGILEDIDEWLEGLAPMGEDYQHHNTGETNGDSHLKNILVGHQVIVPITKGQLDLGPWQQVFYAEFDGKRRKRLMMKVIGE